jgi:hypothetical protein
VAALNLRRWRCWWQPPFGHVDELLDYVDALSGRWTARIRCARCGRESALTIGDRGDLRLLPTNPLTMYVPRQGGRSLPPQKRPGLAPTRGHGQVELPLPDGGHVAVRAVAAQLSLGRRRTLYLAATEGRAPVVSGDLRTALGRACPGLDDAWLDRTARQLEAELPVRS